MKKMHFFAMLLMTGTMLMGLLAGPFASPSLAQNGTPKPTRPAPTKSPTPFVSHRVSAGTTQYTGDQLRAAYDMQPLIDAGFDGAGQAIALIENKGFAQSDIDAFVKRKQLSKPHIETILVGGNKSKSLPVDIEATADIEIVLTLAPKATILVYETPLAVDAFSRIALDRRAQVASMSLALCEPVMPDGGFPAIHSYMLPFFAPRISIFVGSGDWGAFGCAQQLDPKTRRQVVPSVAQSLAISALASDPSVTAVGGTILHLQNGHYAAEEVWNTFQLLGASGGGVSSYWPLPAYQSAYYLSDVNPRRMRQIPDVSASADNYGLIMYGAQVRGTGTSLSTPLWAVGTLLVNQYLTTKLKDPRAVIIAPEMLYELKTAYAAGKVSLPPFHDVTKGDNRYYSATAGYNLATGLGTPDFYNIAQDAEQMLAELRNGVEPTESVGFVNRGEGYYKQGKLDLALADYNLAIALDPKSARAFTGRGIVYRNQAKLDQARDSFTQAIAVDPSYAPAYAELGALFDAEHNFGEALQTYKTYLDLMGNDADPKIVARVNALEQQTNLDATPTPAP